MTKMMVLLLMIVLSVLVLVLIHGEVLELGMKKSPDLE